MSDQPSVFETNVVRIIGLVILAMEDEAEKWFDSMEPVLSKEMLILPERKKLFKELFRVGYMTAMRVLLREINKEQP